MDSSAHQEPSHQARLVADRLVVDRVTAEVFEGLGVAGIRPILLKGPSIARWLYSDEVRSYVDCDLLVAPEQVIPAGETLARLGFECVSVASGVDRPTRVTEWRRPSDGGLVDLHHGLIGIEVSAEMTWAALSKGTEEITVAGRRVEILGLPGRVLHVVLHAAQHGPEVMRSMTDLQKALQSCSGSLWLEARDLADLLDARDAFAAGLGLNPNGVVLAHELGLSIPVKPETVLRAAGADSSALFMAHLATRDGFLGKAGTLLRKIFPPVPYMRSWLQTSRAPVSGLAAGYLYRPVWLARRALPALRRWLSAKRRASGR